MSKATECQKESIVASDSLENWYLASLDRRLADQTDKPGATLEDIIIGAQGAFPLLVLQRLRNNNNSSFSTILPSSNYNFHPSYPEPELHPLDYEWYFNVESINLVAKTFKGFSGKFLCLTTPTLAWAIARFGKEVILVDRNPLILKRFPQDLNSLYFCISDLLNPLPLSNLYEIVFFDAPWYLEYILLWLWRAFQAVKIGGLIAFALFPQLLRQSANYERLYILDLISNFGHVEIWQNALFYDTPLFEQEVLWQSGIFLKNNWRCADLVLLHISKKPSTPFSEKFPFEEKWETFLFNKQVVKLRQFSGNYNSLVISSPKDCPAYFFPSVSREDPRRKYIDLWTSRNRAAKVGNNYIISLILGHLQRGLTFNNIKNNYKPVNVHHSIWMDTISKLQSILEISYKEKNG